MPRSDDELLRTALQTARRAVDQLTRDRDELARTGHPDGAAKAAAAIQSAQQVADTLKTNLEHS